MGVTIRIIGWLNDGRYLVYSLNQLPYIVDTTTLKQRPVDFGPIDLMNYFW